MLKPMEKDSITETVHGRHVSESPSLPRLFGSFLRLGVTAFGGPAMVAYIRDLAVRKHRWVSPDSFADGTALCQSIPGATAMQMAGYVGLRARGALGALAAFVGFGLPAFILMTILSVVYAVSRDLQPVASAFLGLHVIVVALVANAVVTFGRSTIKNWRDAVLAFGAGAFLFERGSPIVAILASAGVGMILYHGIDLPIKSLHSDGQSSGPARGPSGRMRLYSRGGRSWPCSLRPTPDCLTWPHS